MEIPSTPKRYHLLDAARGFAILNVVIFHFLFDLYVLHGKNPGWPVLPIVEFWRLCVCWLFISLSGFIWSQGKYNNWRRGLMLNILGLLITLVSWLFFPEHIIKFGILNFIGTAILLLIALYKLLDKIPPVIGICASIIGYFLFRNVSRGFLSLGSLVHISLPEQLYQWKVLAPLGFPSADFTSADYFPVLPWIFIYILGYFIHMALAENGQLPRIFAHYIPILSPMGTHTLLIYLLHQPVCLLLVTLMVTFGL